MGGAEGGGSIALSVGVSPRTLTGALVSSHFISLSLYDSHYRSDDARMMGGVNCGKLDYDKKYGASTTTAVSTTVYHHATILTTTAGV